MSNKELISLYTEFSNHHANYYTRMWMVFRICERIILKLGSQLKEKIKDEHKVKELLRIFSIPLKPNDITNERMDLLKIAIMKPALKENELKNQIKIHTNRYQHIPMFDFDHDPFTEDHFLKELQLIKNPEEELIKIESSFEDRNTQFQKRLKELNPNNELENLITMLKKAVFLRDYRDKIRQQLNLKLKDLYKEIGSRIGLDNKSIGLLTNDEIESHLEKSMDFDRQELENRKNAFFLIQNRDKIEIYSGQSASEKAKEHNLYKKEENKRTLQGSTGSPGKIKGTAKIIYTNLDLKKINEGDIMVAAMTRQDFVPHMRKSKAVITNEGGVTCHAAIIARELGIPCIVGTENATELLNDGDLIEVDATKGIINKL